MIVKKYSKVDMFVSVSSYVRTVSKHVETTIADHLSLCMALHGIEFYATLTAEPLTGGCYPLP